MRSYHYQRGHRTNHEVDVLIRRNNLENTTFSINTPHNLSLHRCWCGGCELVEDGRDQYDRHGTASCVDYPCSGDPTRQCGDNDGFSLYYRGTCGQPGKQGFTRQRVALGSNCAI